ncbi:beta-defensin 125 [Struthio camelus]|uniref:beta-defensin 125 n=1 Tax=Struthio camelus TaxID=8801 RepID=UPI003604282F
MRILQLLFAIIVMLFFQDVPGLPDSQQCRNNHGHCRRLCFHMERWAGSCSNGRQRCCK